MADILKRGIPKTRGTSIGERIYELNHRPRDSIYDPLRRMKREQPLMPNAQTKFLSKEDYTVWLRERLGFVPPAPRVVDTGLPSKPFLSDEDASRALQLTSKNSTRFVTEIDKVQLVERDFHTLAPGRWLNDEIINCYIKLLCLEELPVTFHAFTSLFWTYISSHDPKAPKKPLAYNYAKVKRWTRRQNVDIFEKDIVIMPVNLSDMHWTLGALDFRKKRIRTYDSMGTPINNRFVEFMLKYLNDEHQDKKGCPLPGLDEWEGEEVVDMPIQENGYDCGVFTCRAAECLLRDISFNFTQNEMVEWRLIMCLELMDGAIWERLMK